MPPDIARSPDAADTARNCPIPPDTSQISPRYRQTPLDHARYCQISRYQPDSARYRQITPDIARYRQIPPDAARNRQIPPDTARYRQILPDAARARYKRKAWQRQLQRDVAGRDGLRVCANCSIFCSGATLLKSKHNQRKYQNKCRRKDPKRNNN